ncbi:MAG: hypothetical protein L0G99_07390 [Propionibacteriales bacterium]|nr:hypothetical protein [Propionibacteriales bacterium]
MFHRNIILAHAWFLTAPDRLQERATARLNERGNNSLEMAIIISVVVVVALAVTVFIKTNVDKKLGGIKGL